MKYSRLLNVRYMPRWVTVILDLLITFFSIVLSYLLRYNFNTEEIRSDFFIKGISITVLSYFIFFIAFRSYKEIIRHTTIRGVIKILYATLAASALLFLLNAVFQNLGKTQLVPYSIVLINFFISFCMLAGSRVFIKKLFETASRMKKEPVIIFGAGSMGQMAFKKIMQDKTSSWKVIAFIDDDPIKISKYLAGIPIYELSQVGKLLKKNKIERVIVAINHLSVKRRNEVATFFIEHNIKVSILPSEQLSENNPFKVRQLKDIRIEELLEREPIRINNNAISATLRSKRILVTGAAGSIGAEIVKQVALFSPEIIILCDIAESPLHSIGLQIQENFKDVTIKLFIANITDTRRMEYVFKNYTPDIVFHAAAYKHVPMMEEHPQEAVLNNIAGTEVIANLSVLYNVERFVMISTDKAVNPTNVMGASKRVAEMYIQAMHEHIYADKSSTTKTVFVTTRFGNVLASNGSVIPRFREQLEKGGPLTVTHPDITRFFMTIPEACQLVLEAGVMGKGGEVFVFDMGSSIRIADLAKKMIALAGLKLGEDIEIIYTGLRPGEKLFEEVLSNAESTLPTYHEKIKIAKVKSFKYEDVKTSIADLIMQAKKGSDWDCVRLIKEIVPEFKSNNSKFEKLDREIAGKTQLAGRNLFDYLPITNNQ